MSLLSVLYSSDAVGTFDDARLDDLLTQSRRSNERDGLTGMLLYRAGRFIQVLEGEAAEVRALVARIGGDERHTNMRVLLEEPITQREFADWTMGYQPISAPSSRPEGFRDTFDDLEGRDVSAVRRAARELSMWFRVRAA